MTDQFEPSRKLDAIDDPKVQAWGETLIDRVTAISGNDQLRTKAAIDEVRISIDELREIIAILRAEGERSQDELRTKIVADTANRTLIAEYLGRESARDAVFLKQQEVVSAQLTALTTEFHGVVQAVNDLALAQSQLRRDFDALNARDAQQHAESSADRADIVARLGRAEMTLGRIEQSFEDRDQLIAQHHDYGRRIGILERRMDARPSPEEAKATYEGVQQIKKHLGLVDGDGS